jgi:tRNA-splicing ligase RtcB
VTFTGNTLREWGYQPGPWFRGAIDAAEAARVSGATDDELRALVSMHAPPPAIPLRAAGELAYHLNIRPEGEGEAENIAAVAKHMDELMRVPTVVAGAVMPDACPSESTPGTIPVGGVLAANDAIHPGWHSADICCSMALTVFPKDTDATALLDAGMKLSHFGGGGRPRGEQWHPSTALMERFEANPFLKPHLSAAIEHFGTQGDGNHFFYVGRLASTGDIGLVTHHGSRKPGAMLYRAGIAAADNYRRQISPETGRHNSWIPASSRDGETYWEALQIVRTWTKENHYIIHDLITSHLNLVRLSRFWNEHNFVFRKSDGLFYHAKGATPAYGGYADDDCGLTLVPLNMAEPILITRGKDAENGLGFAPHGAGRNFSRGAYMRQNAGKTPEQMVAEQTAGIDARFFCGVPDASELPGAYKNAATVRRQIDEYGLAEVVDTVEPIGCIMAGDWQRDAPWRKKKQAKRDSQDDAP